MKGILFKPEMIKAIVEGRKTATRRAEAVLREINKEPNDWELMIGSNMNSLVWLFRNTLSEILDVKPRYQVAETVYIKEKYGELGWFDKGVITRRILDKAGMEHDIIYPSENPDFEWRGEDGGIEYTKAGYERSYWKSPMMMPEWAAHYFIKIKAVRAERLQEITPEDCVLEGYPFGEIPLSHSDREFTISKELRLGWYKDIWNSLNKDYPWEMNPWVFRYEFELRREHGLQGM